MCWDAKTSIVTFVIGTVFNVWNVWHYKNPTITAISILWEWVLLMQLFEAFAWKNQPTEGKCNSTNKWAAKGAYLANVTQPIVFALAMLAVKGNDLCFENKIAAAVIILLYMLWLLYAANAIPEVLCLTPDPDGCSNLTYMWWRQFPGNASVYIAAIILLILVLARPLKFALMQITYIALTFGISANFYSCGVGSVWCWFAAFAPLLVGPMWEASQK